MPLPPQDPLLLSLERVANPQLDREASAREAASQTRTLLIQIGRYIGHLHERPLGPNQAMAVALCAGRASQYDAMSLPSPESDEAESDSSYDPVASADLQAASACCSLLLSRLLTPEETFIHAGKLDESIHELDELDPAAADHHRAQRQAIMAGEMKIPVPAGSE